MYIKQKLSKIRQIDDFFRPYRKIVKLTKNDVIHCVAKRLMDILGMTIKS